VTILSRVVGPGFELTVCGTPTPEWLDWLATTDAPLTAGQRAWRELGRVPGGQEPGTAPAHRKPEQFDLVDTEEL
jgi:hypothetical protein